MIARSKEWWLRLINRWRSTEESIRQEVWVAVRQADHRYDGASADSQGTTRAEYVGRAALTALYTHQS